MSLLQLLQLYKAPQSLNKFHFSSYCSPRELQVLVSGVDSSLILTAFSSGFGEYGCPAELSSLEGRPVHGPPWAIDAKIAMAFVTSMVASRKKKR